MTNSYIAVVLLIPPTLLRLYLHKMEVDVALAVSAIIGVLAYLLLHVHELGCVALMAGSHILMRVDRAK